MFPWSWAIKFLTRTICFFSDLQVKRPATVQLHKPAAAQLQKQRGGGVTTVQEGRGGRK
jgi:hypothetical protein